MWKRWVFCIAMIPFGFLFSEENSSTLFYIVRHGQTDWNVERRIQGHSDIPLNETGREQAIQMNEQLRSFPFDYCLSSDLQRATETARIILGSGSSLAVHVDPRLREYNFGLLEGHLAAEFEKRSEQKWAQIETDEEVCKRAVACLQETANAHPGANILLTSHGGVMANLLAQHFSVSPSDIRVQNLALVNTNRGK